MNNQEVKYIKHIHIKRLWNRFDVDWELNEDVNILVGENGTGKSTILRSIVDLFESIDNLSKGLQIIPNDKIEQSMLVYSSQKNEIRFGFEKDMYRSIVSIYDKKNDIECNNRNALREKDKTNFEFFYKNYKPNFISTFDVPIPYLNGNKKDFVKTNLDVDLDDLEKEFIAYRFKKLRRLIQVKNALKSETYFYDTVNRLFEPTGKQLNREDEKLSFITSDNNNLHWSDLSSGEKQFLIILMTVLCQDEKPSVLIMDEPEISLHLRWQYELIEIIRTLNPNCQLIIATHSPGIYGKGWRDKVIFIKDIIPQMQKQLV